MFDFVDYFVDKLFCNSKNITKNIITLLYNTNRLFYDESESK